MSQPNKAQVTITGRNVEVPDHFQEELQHEPNPRRDSEADRIQSTATGKGHIARAEAKEDSFYAALETALGKMERSLRKVKVRRENVKSGHRAQKGTGEIAAEMVAQAEAQRAKEERYVDPYAETVEDVRPGQIVRTKEHPATPMSVDDALSEMELVGHDFFLFVNEENNKPSVVYRRHAFDYGLISLAEDAEA